MEAKAFLSARGISTIYSARNGCDNAGTQNPATFSPLLIQSMATQKSIPLASKTVSSRKLNSTVFPLGEGPRSSPISVAPPVKFLTRVEELKLLTKAEKAGLLSAAEKLGLSLSAIEKLGLLTKAEELGILSAATDPGTPGALLSLGLGLLLLGPSCVYLVPEDYSWQVALQVLVAFASVVGGSASLAASNLVSRLQNETKSILGISLKLDFHLLYHITYAAFDDWPYLLFSNM